MRKSRVDVQALRTRLAKKFVSLADEVTEGFEGFDVGLGGYSIGLTCPPGQSTGGGRQALQHLCLVPQNPGAPSIVAGTVNAVAKEAELRTFEYVDAVHRARFHRALDVTARQWEELLRRATAIFAAAEIATRLVGPPPDLVAAEARGTRGAPLITAYRFGLATFVFVTVLALLVVWKVATAT
jgi:hypothetical protein